jgi:D-3-phosphoglycerate dehydrogenase
MRSIPQAYKSLTDREATLDSREKINTSKKDVIWLHESIKEKPYLRFRGSEISEKYLGLVGIGAIGSLVGIKAKALGMKVLVYDFFVDESTIKNQILSVCMPR